LNHWIKPVDQMEIEHIKTMAEITWKRCNTPGKKPFDALTYEELKVYARIEKKKAAEFNGNKPFAIRYIDGVWFDIMFFWYYHLPYYLLLPIAWMHSGLSKSCHMLGKGRHKLSAFLGSYDFFLQGAWIFDTRNLRALQDAMDGPSQDRFLFAPKEFNMLHYQMSSCNDCIAYSLRARDKMKKADPGKSQRALAKFQEKRRKIFGNVFVMMMWGLVMFFGFNEATVEFQQGSILYGLGATSLSDYPLAALLSGCSYQRPRHGDC